ncbi:MAG: CBS domain-containing protein [Chloroflexota bacterium]
MKESSASLTEQMEFTRVHELVYELRIEQVMTPKVLTLKPSNTMREAKELFRLNRISGAPVLKNGRILGIVSIEDIIVALERHEIDLPVGDRMTGNVVAVRADETVVQAVNKFAQTRFGRMPVVDERGRLAGIITRGDIVRGLLKAFDVDYRQGEQENHRTHPFFEDLLSDRTAVTVSYSIPSGDVARGGDASGRLKKAIARLGIDPVIARRAAIAAYEAEMNIIIHSEGGGEMTAELRPDSIVIQARDKGPGIADLERAMQPGYSTAPDWIRELGFGAGMGLSNIKSSADELHIDTGPGRGTHLHILFYLEKQE